MNANVIIDERGWQKIFWAPPSDLYDRSTRLQQVEQAFALLSPVCRPLVIQTTYGLRDEFGEPALDGPDVPATIAWARGVPNHVHARPTVAGPLPTSRDVDISPAGIREWLQRTTPADTKEHTGDWLSLVSLATEVRAFVATPTLNFGEFLQPVTSHGHRSERWFAGPVGDFQFERTIPVKIELYNALNRVSLELSWHWQFVEPAGRPAKASFERVFSELQAAGFVDRHPGSSRPF